MDNYFSNLIDLDNEEDLSSEQRTGETELELLKTTNKTKIQNVVLKNTKDKAIIRFVAPSYNIDADIEVPLNITANDLVVGIGIAYQLNMDLMDAHDCYLSCDNPIALIKGNKLLGEIGIRDGSLITYTR